MKSNAILTALITLTALTGCALPVDETDFEGETDYFKEAAATETDPGPENTGLEIVVELTDPGLENKDFSYDTAPLTLADVMSRHKEILERDDELTIPPRCFDEFDQEEACGPYAFTLNYKEQLVGMRVFFLPPDHPLIKLGYREGEIIYSVNGHPFFGRDHYEPLTIQYLLRISDGSDVLDVKDFGDGKEVILTAQPSNREHRTEGIEGLLGAWGF